MYKNQIYPEYLKHGPGSRFIEEFAKEYCKGRGANIGYGSESGKIFDNCLYLDIKDNINCTDINFVNEQLDYVFSSHCLEHMDDWKSSLLNWISKLKSGGVLFLYLPHYSMEYWLPENNKKHKHVICPKEIDLFLREILFPLFVTGPDLYWSYCVVGQKC